MNRILLATDGSPSSRQATAGALALATATGWQLEVITVWQLPTTMFADLPQQAWDGLAETAEEHARNLVDEVIATANTQGVAATGTTVRGDPVTEICAAAEGAGLLVVGAHGWGAVKRLVFGSVSSSVLHEAPCPVLVVREDVPVPAAAVRVAEGAEA